MATCNDCIHVAMCSYAQNSNNEFEHCANFRDRSRFVELNIAKKIKHTPYIDKMREFPKLGLVNGISERSIFWACSKCELWVSPAHNFCPNCGAKFEAEQALKERIENDA